MIEDDFAASYVSIQLLFAMSIFSCDPSFLLYSLVKRRYININKHSLVICLSFLPIHKNVLMLDRC